MGAVPRFDPALPMLLSVLLVLAASPAPAAQDVPQVGIPFACGRIHAVSQGHETGSHLNNDTYAWDFRMPEGTPVVAARDGVIRLARGDSHVGGCDPRFASMANYVVLDHQDGLETQYLHFSAVVVRPGESVKQGQLLGFSGNTGWSCGAHLHFKVALARTQGWNNPSVPARILGYGDPIRDTMIASPACREVEKPMVATGLQQDAREALLSLSSGAPLDEHSQASGGIPPGAEALLHRLGEAQAQPGEAQPEGREPRALSASGGTAQAR